MHLPTATLELANARHARARHRQLWVAAAIFSIVALLPLFVRDVYLQNVLVLTLLYAALSQSWNILGGYCGQISLGHAIYFGIGAYVTSALFAKFGISPWIGFALGAVLSAIVALLVGFLTFSLKGHYFTIATIVIAEIALLLVHNWDYLGGALGIQWPLGPDSWATMQFAQDKLPYFYFVLALLILTWAVTWTIEESRAGYWWRAVKDNPEAAQSLGVDIFRSKMMAAALSAVFTGIGGGLYAAFVSFIDPESVMSFRFSLLFALPAVLGGIGTLWGPIIGAAVLIPMTEITRSYLGGSGNGVDLIIYGALILMVALLRPQGLVSLFEVFKRGDK